MQYIRSYILLFFSIFILNFVHIKSQTLIQKLSITAIDISSSTTGDLYVTNTNKNTISKISTSYEVSTVTTAANKPKSILVIGNIIYFTGNGKSSKLYSLTMGQTTPSELASNVGTESSDIVSDGNGNLFVAGYKSNKIYKVSISSGTVSTYAGSGKSGSYEIEPMLTLM